MTDEEMAEEYAKGLCKTCTVDTCRICKKRKRLEQKEGFVGCACTLGFIGVVKKNFTTERSNYDIRRKC